MKFAILLIRTGQRNLAHGRVLRVSEETTAPVDPSWVECISAIGQAVLSVSGEPDAKHIIVLAGERSTV